MMRFLVAWHPVDRLAASPLTDNSGKLQREAPSELCRLASQRAELTKTVASSQRISRLSCISQVTVLLLLLICSGCAQSPIEEAEHHDPEHYPASFADAVDKLNEYRGQLSSTEGESVSRDKVWQFTLDTWRWLPALAAATDMDESKWNEIDRWALEFEHEFSGRSLEVSSKYGDWWDEKRQSLVALAERFPADRYVTEGSLDHSDRQDSGPSDGATESKGNSAIQDAQELLPGTTSSDATNSSAQSSNTVNDAASGETVGFTSQHLIIQDLRSGEVCWRACHSIESQCLRPSSGSFARGVVS